MVLSLGLFLFLSCLWFQIFFLRDCLFFGTLLLQVTLASTIATLEQNAFREWPKWSPEWCLRYWNWVTMFFLVTSIYTGLKTHCRFFPPLVWLFSQLSLMSTTKRVIILNTSTLYLQLNLSSCVVDLYNQASFFICFSFAGPINIPRRLNSGFYFARSDDPTIAAMVKVVKHAANSGMSEQPSFYDTLCGENGSNRLGNDRCVEPETNLTVHFLDRNLFPNGAYQGLWQRKSIRSACAKKGCFVLHNNWISGRQKKLERQVSSGLWEFDISTRICVQSWHLSWQI